MTGKTISLDDDAYERLESVKRPQESFSDTIKRVVRKPVDADVLLETIDRFSPESVAAIEEQVAGRRRRRRPARG